MSRVESGPEVSDSSPSPTRSGLESESKDSSPHLCLLLLGSNCPTCAQCLELVV